MTISTSEDESSTDQSSTDDQANTGDASYSFTIDTDDYKRVESADASGNVQGSFSYNNEAGNHDLSYVAGSGTGFVATGGSLSDPNAITSKITGLSPTSGLPSFGILLPANQIIPSRGYIPSVPSSTDDGSSDDQANTGDASYSFTINTDDYKRKEFSDAQGNIQGGYSYKNSAGQHDLNFVAGSSTGFLPTSGSLQTAPGLTETQLKAGEQTGSGFKGYYGASSGYSGPQSRYASSNSRYSGAGYLPPFSHQNFEPNLFRPTSKLSYTLDNVSVKTYLPPHNEKGKFGYIFDTKY